MVHSLFPAEAKTEGDSNKSHTKATSGSSQECVSFGSGDNVCLFSSREGEFFEFGSKNLHTPTTSRSQAHLISPTSTIENGFSIDSRDKYCPQEVSSSSLDQRSRRWSRYWKTAKRSSSSQLTRLLKMGLKRYYLLLLCLILVIVSCLIASFAISRSVGELDTDDSSGSSSHSSGHDGNNNTSAAQSLSLSSAASEFERRTIDLIDLIECGKTFAFTRIRIRIRVPKSSPNYTQQPSFLQQAHSTPQTISSQSNDEPNVGPALQQQQQDQRPTKFILTSARESAPTPDSDQLESEASEHPLGSGDSSTITSVTTSNPLAMDIKPVTLPGFMSKEVATVSPPPIRELTALLAASSPSSSSSSTSPEAVHRQASVIELIGDPQMLDPLEGAASELRVSATSINRTLMDCFVVDIEKRFGQKVSFEDKYRSVASTRYVPFAKMMETLIECRRLTWSSLPPLVRIQQESPATDGQQPLVAAQSAPTTKLAPLTADQQASGAQFINSMLSPAWNSWLNGEGSGSATSRSNEPESLVPAAAESRQTRPQTVKTPSNGAQDAASEEEKRQGSYLNMGISMVSGIVPNTLWCGLGDRAANYSELGSEFQVDSCCRAHDHCPIRLKPFTTDYGLVNWSVSTRSHCECDLDFNNCLKSINSTLSNVIRVLYFRFVGLQCIDVEGRNPRDGMM